MRYEHSFEVGAPVDAVAAFHRRSASMAEITPPPIVTRFHAAPELLNDGDEVDFTLWLGPMPLRWRARISDVGDDGFLDRQVRGPFRAWSHWHSFEAVDNGTTSVTDTIEYSLRMHPLWGAVGLGMALGLPLLFSYRSRRTRGILEAPAEE
jgi:ligand-binding SRPBCC domain-containing protein